MIMRSRESFSGIWRFGGVGLEHWEWDGYLGYSLDFWRCLNEGRLSCKQWCSGAFLLALYCTDCGNTMSEWLLVRVGSVCQWNYARSSLTRSRAKLTWCAMPSKFHNKIREDTMTNCKYCILGNLLKEFFCFSYCAKV